MPDSATKLPQNRIHLFDPVGLINDGYAGYGVSSYAAQPRRATKSYDGFAESNEANGGLRSSDSFTDADSGGLRSYDSFSTEVKGGEFSFNDHRDDNNSSSSSRSSDPDLEAVEEGSGEISMYTTVTLTNRSYEHGVKEANGGGLRFGVDAKVKHEYDDSTPLWRPISPIRTKAVASLNPSSPRFVNSSPLHPSSPKAMGSPWNPTSPKAMGSPLNPSSPKAMGSPLNPSSPKAIGSPLNRSSPKFINSSPLNPTSPRFVNSSPLHPSSPKSPGSPLHPNHHHHHHPPMSPNSRTQAIARGRKELMEMVRDLPETFYELSLKDIVEQKQPDKELQKEIDPAEEKKPVKEIIRLEEKKKDKKSSKMAKKREKKKKMARSKSVDNGKFLLKTSVFPILWGSKKSKKSLGPSGSFKIAPVPKPQPTPTRSTKGPEKDWWRRRSCMSSESDESNGLSSSSTSSRSSRSSSLSNSNSSNGRHGSRFLPNCCFFNGRILRRIKDKK